MTEILLFGGTAEGRVLCELLDKKRIDTLLCVATEYGEALLPPFNKIRVHRGRLDKGAMEILLEKEKPRLVIDATHPYATVVSANIGAACEKTGVKHLRLCREALARDGCVIFSALDQLVCWLNERQGRIFSTLGLKGVSALTGIKDYRERVWLRILPDTAGISACLKAGFKPQQLICMQGPFTKELNIAMFRAMEADILLTKESGATGGYLEKLEAARECGMITAVLSRPREEKGLTLEDLTKLIEEDAV